MAVRLYATAQSCTDSLPANDRGRIFSWLSAFAANPRGDGNKLHRVDKSEGLWTARVDQDYRAVLVQDGPDWCVVHVARHEPAYRWAEYRRVCVEDGEVVMVFTPDAVTEITEIAAEQSGPSPILTQDIASDEALLAWGVDEESIPLLRAITDLRELFEYMTCFPLAVSQKVLGAASGDVSDSTSSGSESDERASSPAELDIRRTYYIVDGNEDFLRVIEEPLASWIAFLHPSQHRVAYGHFRGPVKVSGGAGTGKTVVALHRARHLARLGKRVLLTTYADPLCANLQEELQLLCTEQERQSIQVSTVHETALALLKAAGQTPKPDRDGDTLKWLKEIADYEDYARSPEWYVMEWEHVVHAHGTRTLEDYLAVSRAGRGSALQERDRRVVWSVFEKLFARLDKAGITDWATICLQAREALERGTVDRPYDAVVVDEMQDLRPQELRFLAALGGDGEDALMVVGDMTQRIYVPRFTMRSAGIDVIGRSYCLRVNYRTTLQIKMLADAVIESGPGRARPDGAVSVYQGPKPAVCSFATPEEEAAHVTRAIEQLLRSEEFQPHDIAVFARTVPRVKPVVDALEARGVKTFSLSRKAPPDGCVRVGSMLRAKGLEFKAVFAVGVSKDAVPEPKTVEHLFEPAALDEAMERERQMLYVALTRARDDLTVSWTGEPSTFLPDDIVSLTCEGDRR